jgi:hypothetical protein
MGLSNNKAYKNIFELASEQNQINSSLFAFEITNNDEQSYFYYDTIPEKL